MSVLLGMLGTCAGLNLAWGFATGSVANALAGVACTGLAVVAYVRRG